jgi:hypothetical protein
MQVLLREKHSLEQISQNQTVCTNQVKEAAEKQRGNYLYDLKICAFFNGLFFSLPIMLENENLLQIWSSGHFC